MEDQRRIEGDEVHGDKVDGDKVEGDKVEVSSHMRDVYDSMVITVGQVYARSKLEELNDHLARAVSAYEARMYQLVARPTAPPDQPYKFLYAFEIEDTDIFFGRDAASEDLYQTILKDRLTVLHAKSGAGKTSLLNAGLSPHLIREGRLLIHARSYEDPILAIKRAIAPPSLGSWPELLPKLTLHEFLGLTCAHLSRQTELVIILDQFEEFFVFWPERDHRQPFVDALADCYDDKSLPARFIIALRKDYYSDLADFQERIPTILYNEYRLDTMTRQEAREAITGPVAKLGRPVTYEPALLDKLLDDLARGGMEPPHLQIICTRLYEALAENETIINLASYGELGRAEGVLGGYLNDVLNRLPGRGGSIAREVLKELVSSEATRRVLSYGMLAVRVEAEGDELNGVLARLVDARLLRRDEVAGEITYEMAHEYLIEEIRTWIDQSDLAFKQAEELLAREVMNWRVYGTLIPRERLELLHAQRGRLSGLDDEMWECILRSAMQADFAVEDWAELTDEVGESLFLATLDDPQEDIRWAATRGLGRSWGLLEVSELGDKSSMVREAGAEALGQIGDPRTVEPLIAALRDKDTGVRGAAAEALGQIGDPRAVEPLIAALQDETWYVRQAVVRALGQISGPDAVESLVTALWDQDRGVRLAAAEALGELDDLHVVGSLVSALSDEYGLVTEAVVVLRQIGDPYAVESLIVALRDEDTDVRGAAAEALGQIGDPRTVEPLIAALRDENSNVRRVAAWALGKIGDSQAVEPLIVALRDEGTGVRGAAAEALVKIGEPTVKSLVAALRDEDTGVRGAAAEALGQIGDPRAVKSLVAALRDEDIGVRGAAAEALGQIGDPRAVEPLIAALRDKDTDVRGAAAKALGQIGDPCTVEPLIAALRDENSNVRRVAAWALGKIGDSQAVEPLIAALRDEDTGVRGTAAEALGQIGDPRTVEPLIAALGDENSIVRRVAAWALGKIGDSRAVEPLIAALKNQANKNWWRYSVREAAAEALGRIGEPAVEPLIAALQDEDSNMRQGAAWALGRIGELAVEPLIAALRDEDRGVCRAAAQALKKIGTPKALAVLEEWRRYGL